MLEGIPALDLWVEMSHYGEVHHKTSDTIDKVDAHNLASGAAIVAITAYTIAERAEPIAPHIEHAAVGESDFPAHPSQRGRYTWVTQINADHSIRASESGAVRPGTITKHQTDRRIYDVRAGRHAGTVIVLAYRGAVDRYTMH